MPTVSHINIIYVLINHGNKLSTANNRKLYSWARFVKLLLHRTSPVLDFSHRGQVWRVSLRVRVGLGDRPAAYRPSLMKALLSLREHRFACLPSWALIVRLVC